MAARWGTGEETLTIGGMEFFTAGGHLEGHDLEEDETDDGLSDFALSSLDAGGILGTFQGYIDNSIISIIDDTGAQAGNKYHFDEENELSLLTALTEILDNTDDENMSPFDTIPDTELLVSPMDCDGSSLQKFLSLSLTPLDQEMSSMDDQFQANCGKIDGRFSGPNWDLFPDSTCSTPKRHIRHKSLRGCLPHRARTEPTQQRSDGEYEEIHSLEKKSDTDFAMETGAEMSELDRERLLKLGTPCIINTENVALNDLVKYMHPYCLPAITVCLEPEDSKSFLNDALFLEIVSEDGECIKVPVVMEHTGDILNPESSEENLPTLGSFEELHWKTQSLPESSSEQRVPEFEMHNEKNMDNTEICLGSTDQVLKPIEDNEHLNKTFTDVPGVEEISSKPLTADEMVDTALDNKSNTCASNPNLDGVVPDSKKSNEPEISVPVPGKERMQLKGKKSSKNKRPNSLKSKVKSKNKGAREDKSPDVLEILTPQSVTQPAANRSSNPSLQESDFLGKTLDQVKKDSQMELRSSKAGRTKMRTRANMDNSNPERKMTNNTCKNYGIFISIEKEQSKCPVAVTEVDCDLIESNTKLDGDQSKKSDMTPESALNDANMPSDKASSQDTLISAAADIRLEETSNMEESSPSKSEDVKDGDCTQHMKETKPKSLSLNEYRKRLQQRKPNPGRGNENMSCSKWPSVPEPPTELAELPCLILPTTSNKTSVEEKVDIPNKDDNSSVIDVPVSLASVPTKLALTPVAGLELQQLKPTDGPCTTIVNNSPPIIACQPNVPPPFYPPTWPTVPSHPAYYPGLTPLSAVPHFPNGMSAIMHMQPPPPVLSWPPFPPPPIAMGPVYPTGWVSGLPPPYWSNAHVPQAMPENGSMQISAECSGPFSIASLHVLPDQKMSQDTPVPPIECNNQNAVLANGQTKCVTLQKPEDGGVGTKESKIAETLKSIKHAESSENISSKPGPQVCPNLNMSDLQMAPTKAAEKTQSVPEPESKTANVPALDLKSANQVVFKIMEILKKSQNYGFQIKPPLESSVSVPGTPPVGQKSPITATLKPIGPDQTVLAGVNTQDVPTSVPAKPCIVPVVKPKVDDKILATGCDPSKVVVGDKYLKAIIVTNQEAQKSVPPPPVENLHKSGKSIQPNLPVSDQKEAETGIEASDLSSLLEQFEKYAAKAEASLPHSPDTLAIGISGSGKPVEKKIHDKHLPPQLVNTAGLVHPATPPHQLWKSSISGHLTGKSKSSQVQERGCASPLKTTKLIEAKPLPQSRLRNRNHWSAQHVPLPPVHVASGEHDYCILSVSRPGKGPVTAGNRAGTITPPPPSQCEEGSRWNVKHHQNITIKPIVPFNQRQQNQASAKLPTSSPPSVVPNLSTNRGLVKPVAPCKSIQKDSKDPLDHRTPVLAESSIKSPPGSVLMSPDSSPCRSERAENRTDVRRENGSVSQRSLRCYRKYISSPSPQEFPWRGRSSGSRSDSTSSSSRSRSRSPPSKRRRTYRSRSRYSSRSSSRSSSSRSSSRSSRSRSPSTSRSRSRSRSRSPYRRRYRSRSRRCQSRDSYQRQKMCHKERAIEERRVVYVGKINDEMTRSELRRRFCVFGEIEDCTIHFREQGDNYGFVTYRCAGEAFDAIENGHKLRLPDELPFDLCFGGRRQFCKSNYADLDSNRNEFDTAPVRSKLENLDFDTLLRQVKKSQRR